MGCVYKESCDQCGMYEKSSHDGLNYLNSEFGFSTDNDGSCSVDDDPKPDDNCSMYEAIDSYEDEDEDE